MSRSEGQRPPIRPRSEAGPASTRPTPRTGPGRRTSPTRAPEALVAATPASLPEPVAADVTATSAPVPFDRASDPDRAALDLLSIDLAAAGRRARTRKAQATAALPDPVFGLALRGRLLQPAGAGLGSLGLPGLVLEPDAPSQPKRRAGSRGRRRFRGLAWAVAGIAVLLVGGAALAVASGLVGATAPNRAGEVSGATLLRGGGSQALTAGMALAVGDEIRVAAGGHATLLLGSSQARLAGGADVKLNDLSASNIQIALLAGRAYDRVVLPTGGSYQVLTGPYAWTATGTAFDLDRTKVAGGGEQVVLLALEHAVGVAGPAANQQVPEGTSVTVVFGSPSSDGVTVGPIPPADFTDPWLISNAKTDEALGYPIGALAGVALAPNGTPAAVPSPSPAPTAGPSDTPGSTPGASPSPSVAPTATPRPTQGPTPTPTLSPSPTPTTTPQPSMSLALDSCPGGIVLSWSKYAGSGFVRYVTLRDTTPSVPTTYVAGKVVAGTSTTSITRTTADDPTVADGSSYWYRTLALGSNNKVLQASLAIGGLGFGRADLGPAAVGGPVVAWGIYKRSDCFSQYDVLYYLANPDITPTTGTDYVTVGSRTQTNAGVPAASGFSSGDTVWFRIQVVRRTALGQFVVGETTGTAPSYTYP